MEKETTILSVLGEGGSVALYKKDGQYYFSSNEAALYDMLSEEDAEGLSLSSTSARYKSFDKAFEEFMASYPVFRLYPDKVHPDYKKRIGLYFQIYKLKNPGFYDDGGWEEIL